MRSRSSRKIDRVDESGIALTEITLRRLSGDDGMMRSVLIGLIDPAFVMARYRGRRRREERVKTLLDDCVAFARCLLEAGPIEDLDRSPAIAYEGRRLH